MVPAKRGRTRGRFMIVVPLDHGRGSLTITTAPDKSMSAKEIVEALRREITLIEKLYVKES